MTTKRDKYLKWKHELFDSCGQCVGFRAKGISLNEVTSNNQCQPDKDCHTTCAALGMGKRKVDGERIPWIRYPKSIPD